MWVVKDMIVYFGNILCTRLTKKTLGNVNIPYGRYFDQDNGSRDKIHAHSKEFCEIHQMQQTEVYHYG